MRRLAVGCAVPVLVLVLSPLATQAQFHQQHSHPSAPAAPSVNHFSAQVAPRASISAVVAGPVHHYVHSSTGFNRIVVPWYFWGSGYPLFWGGGAYTPAFGAYSYQAPLSWGAGPNAPVPAVAPRVDNTKNEAAEPPAPRAEPKITNAETKAKAGKYIGYGDGNFKQQRYLAAFSRYKTAGDIAADLAEPAFRKGFALVALGQGASAAKSFRRGLAIRADWSDSPFRLDEIYGDEQLAETSHMENLARAVEGNPFDSDLLVALGIELYFDGQRDRAELFLSRAAQLGANSDGLLSNMLAKPAPAEAPRAAKGGF